MTRRQSSELGCVASVYSVLSLSGKWPGHRRLAGHMILMRSLNSGFHMLVSSGSLRPWAPLELVTWPQGKELPDFGGENCSKLSSTNRPLNMDGDCFLILSLSLRKINGKIASLHLPIGCLSNSIITLWDCLIQHWFGLFDWQLGVIRLGSVEYFQPHISCYISWKHIFKMCIINDTIKSH
jgi:hypothetical protein